MNYKYDAFQDCVPLEYVKSCADLVTESFVGESLSFTEKTWKPIVMKKPFILMSGRHAHKYLKVMGYELYDEIFDYSFDDKDFDERYFSIVNQVKELCKLSVNDFSNKIFFLKDKIEYNYNHYKNQSKHWNRVMDYYQDGFYSDLEDSKEKYTDDFFINFLKKKSIQ